MPSTNDIVTVPAHSPGITRLVFSKDGKTVYTGGTDAIMRIWVTDAPTDVESTVLTEHDEPVTWLDCNKEKVLTACEDAAVRIYSADKGDMEGYLTRTEAVPVRSVVFDPKGEKAVVTSDETIFKIISIADTTDMIKITGHATSVRSASWDPKGAYLTTSGADGKIMVWDLAHGEQPVQSKVLDIIPAVDAESDKAACDTTAVWHPSGKYFVVGTKTNDITMYSRDSWAKAGTFSIEGHVGEITGLAFSPNGLYLASAGKDGQIIIWDTEKRRVVERERASNSPPAVTGLAWSPSANFIAFVDADGNFRRWRSPVKAALPHPVTVPSADKKVAPAPSRSDKSKSHDVDLFGEDFNMEDFENDDAADDGELELAEMLEKEQEQKNKDVDEPIVKRSSLSKQMVAVTSAQPPFQPGSTPMRDGKRYLAWNLLGFIQAIDQGSYQYVTVEFYDRDIRTGDRFQDYNQFTMASLGERGALYASGADPDGKNPSVIEYKPYRQASWAPDTRWKHELPAGEVAIAIAAGGLRLGKQDEDEGGGDDAAGCGAVVVATNKGYVRFFSGSGIQEFIWSAGADVVSVAAGEEWAFIVYREGGVSLDGCQNLRYTLVSFDSFEPIQEGRLPLLKKVTLQWMGVTDDGAPTIYDSSGVLHVLQYFRRPGKGMWIPALDTNTLERRVGKQESYWPVAVSETKFHCIILKGLEEYPSPNKPPLFEHNLRMPLLRMERNDKGEDGDGVFEEKIIRQKAAISALRDALGEDDDDAEEAPARELEMDKALVWLIGKACMVNKVQRAFDLCRQLQRPASLRTALQPAQRYHHKGLEQRISALLEDSEQKDALDDHRKQRQRWGNNAAPLEAPPRPPTDSWASSASFDNFPPPVPARNRAFLAPAVPAMLRSKPAPPPPPSALSRESSFVPETQQTVDDPMDMDWPASPPANGKRKRDDESLETDDGNPFDDPPPNKRKISEEPAARPAAPAKSFNPFARKPAAALASNNPFAKQNKAMTTKPGFGSEKSTGGDSKVPPKTAAKKDATARQATLSNHFGLAAPPPEAAPAAKKARGRPPKGTAKNNDSQTTLDGLANGQTQTTATGSQINSDSQMTVLQDADGNTQATDADAAAQDEDMADGAITSEESQETAKHMPAIQETSPGSPGSSDKENHDAVPVADGKSKLAAFRMNVTAP